MAAVLALLSAALPFEVEASEEEEAPRVVVSPHFRVFADGKGEESADEATRALYRGTSQFGARHPDAMRLVGGSELERAVEQARGFEDKLKIAELATELGIDNYKKLDVKKAVRHLREALDTYEELDYELANPERVAEVALYLALSYLEQDIRNLRLFDIFQKMTLLDPSLQIREGFYPDEVVGAYRDAYQSLLGTLRDDGPEESAADKLAAFSDSDFAVYGYAWPEDDLYRVTLYAYSRQEERFLDRESLMVDDLETETMREAGNRLMSRLTPCFIEPDEVVEPTVVQTGGQSPFSLEFGFTYASFLQYPPSLLERTEPWGNYGLSVDGRLNLTREFAVVGGVHVLNSMRDYAGLLADDFTTIRGFVGGDMGVDVGDFDIGFQLSAETATLGDFEVYRDPTCAAARDDCGKELTELDSVFVGVHARPRIYWERYEPFALVASVSTTYYFIPLSGRQFNFPLSGQLSVSYQF